MTAGAAASADRLTLSACRRRDLRLLISNAAITEAAKHGALDADNLGSRLTAGNEAPRPLQRGKLKK